MCYSSEAVLLLRLPLSCTCLPIFFITVCYSSQSDTFDQSQKSIAIYLPSIVIYYHRFAIYLLIFCDGQH